MNQASLTIPLQVSLQKPEFFGSKPRKTLERVFCRKKCGEKLFQTRSMKFWQYCKKFLSGRPTTFWLDYKSKYIHLNKKFFYPQKLLWKTDKLSWQHSWFFSEKKSELFGPGQLIPLKFKLFQKFFIADSSKEQNFIVIRKHFTARFPLAVQKSILKLRPLFPENSRNSLAQSLKKMELILFGKKLVDNFFGTRRIKIWQHCKNYFFEGPRIVRWSKKKYSKLFPQKASTQFPLSRMVFRQNG